MRQVSQRPDAKGRREFLYRPAREAGPFLWFPRRFLLCFYTDLPVRQVSDQQRKHGVVNWFLYRPAREAGLIGTECENIKLSFYTDLPVRQVGKNALTQGSAISFLYRPAREAGLFIFAA